jgi:hypothetical protein
MKVPRVIDEYNLHGLGAEMEQMWTADENRMSLRDLARYFNVQVLEQALEDANVHLLDGEAENLYRLLSDDDIAGAEKTRANRRIEKHNIEVEALIKDFVTYQAVRSYLMEHRNAKYASTDEDPLDREATNLKKLRGKTGSVTASKLEQLRKSEELSLGNIRTIVNIQVVCEDCNAQFGVFELIEKEGCNCSEM